MVNLEWYRSFMAVYRTGSVSKAADTCFITQPAVSQHLAALENASGEKLFVRQPRKMTPTDAGKELYNGIAEAMDSIDRTTRKIESGSRNERAVIKLGCAMEFFNEVLLPVLPADEFRFNVRFGTSGVLADLLAKGELDLIVVPKDVNAEGLEYTMLTREEFAVVGPAGAVPPESSDEIEEWLSRQRWISYGAELPIIRRFWRQSFARRPEFSADQILPNLHAILHAVGCGYGISVLPLYLCREALGAGNVKILWVPEDKVVNGIWIGQRTIDKNNLAVCGFTDALRKAIL